jgi:cytochrome c
MFWIFIALIMAEERPSKLPKSHVRGKQLYEQYCFQCHGSLALSENELAKKVSAPALAGRISKDEYPETIQLIQKGKGLMPSYEMLIDKQDSKRILIYLSRLDEKTGLDPKPKDYIEEENKNNKDVNKPKEDEPKVKKTISNPKINKPIAPQKDEQK